MITKKVGEVIVMIEGTPEEILLYEREQNKNENVYLKYEGTITCSKNPNQPRCITINQKLASDIYNSVKNSGVVMLGIE